MNNSDNTLVINNNGVNTNSIVASVKKQLGRPRTFETQKRVILVDGAPQGRGRITGDKKSNRRIVFIPVNETYDVTKHGIGVLYNVKKTQQHRISIRRVSLSKIEQLAKTPVNIQ